MTTKTPLPKEDYAVIKALIAKVETDPQAQPFKEPVDFQTLGLIDYPSIIKVPMDLSTIKKKLNKGKYATYEDAFSDLQLVWTNCKTYNMADSPIYKMAEHMEKVCKKEVGKLKATKGMEKPAPKSKGKKGNKDDEDKSEDDSDDADQDPNTVTFNEKFSFSEKVKILPPAGLAKMVHFLQEKCPAVIDDLSDDKLQIRVDDIDKNTFDELQKVIEEFSDEVSSQTAKRQKVA